MRIVVFAHALTSCWNHGNAHFLRGVLRELVLLGHAVDCWEPRDGWSRANLRGDAGDLAVESWQQRYPELRASFHDPDTPLAPLVADADLVLVHEWNEPALVAALGRLRRDGARFRLLFHDTHHRAVSDPEAMRRFDLGGYDGVLAFGRTLARREPPAGGGGRAGGGGAAALYEREGWARRAWVWHEAADLRLFRPPAHEEDRDGIVWIGNWGDGERTAELEDFLLRPAREAGLALAIRGVRYPDAARATLARYGARYGGWIANADAPALFARHRLTVHVPRRFYARELPGIPTIRVFEALACGIPLISAPWDDAENLFRPGVDYLVARDGGEMASHMRAVAHDPSLSASLGARGLETVRARHGCAHRARELLLIAEEIDP